MSNLKPRERDAIVQALRAGGVPKLGLRRLHASGGQARGLYAEIARNLSTRTRPDGGALASVVERFVSQSQQDAETRDLSTSAIIRERLAHFEELTGGFDFA